MLFYLGFAALMAHELDAMTQAEWRILFSLNCLPDTIDEVAFVLVHIPLVAGLLWLTTNEAAAVSRWSRLAVALFLAIHAGLHKRLEHSPLYSFDSALSQRLIYGGGTLGLLYLLTVFITSRQTLQTVPQETK